MFPHPVFENSTVRTLAGVSVSAVAAVLVCSLVRQPANWLPLAFVVVVLAVALVFGAAAGILSSLLAALFFAIWLYQPLGNLAVQSAGARAAIGWMILVGTSLSFLLAPEPPRQHR